LVDFLRRFFNFQRAATSQTQACVLISLGICNEFTDSQKHLACCLAISDFHRSQSDLPSPHYRFLGSFVHETPHIRSPQDNGRADPFSPPTSRNSS
jgi:hypothetical protein